LIVQWVVAGGVLAAGMMVREKVAGAVTPAGVAPLTVPASAVAGN
jgi:hypothetical protein